MRVVNLQCPHCGAQLDADATAQTVTCSYCGTSSHVRRRTGFFERVEPPPARPVSSPQANAPPPVIIQPHTKRWVGMAVVLPVVLGIGGTLFAFVMSQIAQDRAQKIQDEAQAKAEANAAKVQAQRNAPSWQGHGPALLYDVDGDGDREVLGRLRYLGDEDSITLAALDGATGRILWESESLGTYEETYRSDVYLAADALVTADDGGVLSGYAARDGAKRWSVPLGERLEDVCAGTDGSVIAVAADGTRPKLDIDNGSTSDADAIACDAPLPNDGDYLGQGVAKRDLDWNRTLREAAGMYRSAVLVREGTDAVIAVGTKTPGTRVPMLARFQGRGPEPFAWTTAVPAGDPLKAKEGEPELVTLSDDAAIVLYEGADGVRLTAFALADGARRWDVAWRHDGHGSPGPFEGMVAGDGYVYISTWGELRAYALADGAHAFTLGR